VLMLFYRDTSKCCELVHHAHICMQTKPNFKRIMFRNGSE